MKKDTIKALEERYKLLGYKYNLDIYLKKSISDNKKETWDEDKIGTKKSK